MLHLTVAYLHWLQAVTKYTASARGLPPEPYAAPGSSKQDISIRDAFLASPGCLLVAADYSQIELRGLAHLSNDVKLIQILRQAGVGGDAFALIAKTWLRKPHDTGQPCLGFFAFHLTLFILHQPKELSLSSAVDTPAFKHASQPILLVALCLLALFLAETLNLHHAVGSGC